MLTLILIIGISLVILNITSFFFTQKLIRKDLKAMEDNLKTKKGVNYCGQSIKKTTK